jgi:sensor histidine kinase regulating citrate/malate metabolism
MGPILLLAAVQGADAGIIITDREGTIQWINAEFSRMGLVEALQKWLPKSK